MRKFTNISILGIGLIGGSIALALKKSSYSGTIVGFDPIRENLEAALQVNAIDIAANTLQEVLSYQGLIILAMPLSEYEQTFRNITELTVGKDTVITDVGSVKAYIQELAEKNLPAGVPFIGGHPMSGSEKSGFEAATPYLFENAYYFVTPISTQAIELITAIGDVIKLLGAYLVVVTPAEHDHIVAKISHAPHVLAAVLANTLADNENIGNAVFAGGGFRDTTRIAASNPYLWKDILLYNKKEVIKALKTVEDLLTDVKRMVQSEEQEQLVEFFQQANLLRESLPKHNKDYTPALYNIVIDIADRPGNIAEITRIISEEKLNIREIEIMHVRENIKGVLRIGFAATEEQACALNILAVKKFAVMTT